LAEVAGRLGAVAGDDAHAEGEAVVLAAELIHAVLRHRGLAFVDTDAQVGVMAVVTGAWIGGDEVRHGGADGGDGINRYSLWQAIPSLVSRPSGSSYRRIVATPPEVRPAPLTGVRPGCPLPAFAPPRVARPPRPACRWRRR